MMNYLLILFSIISTICIVNSTLGPGEKKKQKVVKSPNINLEVNNKDESHSNNDSEDKSVFERNLVKKNIESSAELIRNFNTFCSATSKTKIFKNQVLGYVTPWNNKGYDVAKTFAAKFDYISPVWLQINRISRKKYEFSGLHDVDKKWMKTVKESSNQRTSILPRILFEKFKMEDLNALFNDEDEILALANMLVDNSKKYKFNGYVLEIYMQLSGYGKESIGKIHSTAHIISDVADVLHSNNKSIFLVVPPAITGSQKANSPNKIVFDANDFDLLKDKVDAFSLMTYDYSSHISKIGSNAPLDWIRKNVVYFTQDPKYRSKILLGLNFYGMKFLLNSAGQLRENPEPIVGSQLIDILKQNDDRVEIKFDEKDHEHVIFIKESSGKTIIFYPSLYSIQKRIELANDLTTGISIWEIGQGMNYFYDLF